MKKSHVIKLVLFLGLALMLSACTGIRVEGTPGISLSDEMVFVSYNNFVYGLDTTTGSLVWQFPTEKDNQLFFYAPPLVTDDMVYVGDLEKNFHKLDKETGLAEWTFSEGQGYYIGQAAEDNGSVYAPSNDGNLYAISDQGDLQWVFETGHYLWSQPQVSPEAIYLGSMDHHVYAISKSGEELWSFTMAGAVVGAPVLSADGDTLFVGSVGNEMVALDTSSGERLWKFDANHSVWASPLLTEGTLYFADSGGNLYALDPTTGQMNWPAPIRFSGSVVGGLTATEDGFVFATYNGDIRAYNLDGTPQWERSIAGETFQAPLVTDEHLVLGVINGNELLYSFNLTGDQIWSVTPEN